MKVSTQFDLTGFLSKLNIEYTQDDHDGRDRYKLAQCPFNPEHGKGEAAIFQDESGKLGFKCQHDSCADKHWRDVRKLVDGKFTTSDPAANDDSAEFFTLDEGNFADVVTHSPPPIKWLIDNILPAGTLGILAGSGGVSKTALSLQLACGLATGLSVASLPNRNIRRVLILTAEDSRSDVHRRLHPLVQKLSAEVAKHDGLESDIAFQQVQENIRNNLRIVTLEGRPSTLAEQDGGTVSETARFQYLLDQAKEFKTDLLILDPLNLFCGIEENNNGPAAHFMNLMARIQHETGTTVLLLHHISKGGASSGNTDATAIRGASAFVNRARLALILSPMPPTHPAAKGLTDETRKHYVGLSFAKANGMARHEDIWFKRGDMGLLESVGDLVSVMEKNAETQQLNLISRVTEKVGQLTKSDQQVTEKQFRDQYAGMANELHASDTEVRKAIARAKFEGWIKTASAADLRPKFASAKTARTKTTVLLYVDKLEM